jgi:hypothetical protein
MDSERPMGDPDAGVVDDKMAEARERIGRIELAANEPALTARAPGRAAHDEETTMDTRHSERLIDKAKAAIDDILGLPPGDKTPHGEGRPARDADTPHGSLTADDAEGVPLPGSTTDDSREAEWTSGR